MKYEARLRKVGGSIMVAIPPRLLDALQLSAGAPVALAADSGRLVVEPKLRPRYALRDLLTEARRSPPPKNREWVSGQRKGRELI